MFTCVTKQHTKPLILSTKYLDMHLENKLTERIYNPKMQAIRLEDKRNAMSNRTKI